MLIVFESFWLLVFSTEICEPTVPTVELESVLKQIRTVFQELSKSSCDFGY